MNSFSVATRIGASCAALLIAAGAVAAEEAPKPVAGLDKINHIIVLYLENRSFDNLYGLFPGADGVSQASAPATTQVDKLGQAYDKLPPVLNTNVPLPVGDVRCQATANKPQDKCYATDDRFPTDLENKPYRADKYVTLDQVTGDAWHRYYQEQLQIDDGKMDKYVAWSDAGSLVMGYFDGSKSPMWRLAQDYTLLDHFHHAGFGGSFFNHIFMICGCAPKFPNAPEALKAKLDDKGGLLKDGSVTPDGYAVNTLFAAGGPFPAGYPKDRLVPPQTDVTIGDRLDEKGVDWAWYSGGWDDALAGKPGPLFQFHHQPFAYFAKYAVGTDGAKKHLKDEKDFIEGITRGDLPPVVFFKPSGEDNEHPGYSSVLAGEYHTALLIGLIQRSALWKDSLILVTYDENGGIWDHVAPPKIDKWGPGTRVPAIVISPFAKKGFIDHAIYDTTAIAKLIETRYGLQPLGTRDAASGDLTTALDLQ
jgi:phospholipase C